MLVHTLTLSKTVTDCNTKHPIRILIKSQKMLDKYNNRFYKFEGEDDYRLLKSTRDKHLVGQIILVRSPATCALGDEICQKCYGYNANLNYDIADGVTGFGSQEITKVVNQMILSVKHLLTTVSEEIKFNDNFHKFFNALAGEITPKLNDDDALENIDDYAIYIEPASIKRIDDMDDDSLFNTVIENGEFYVRNLKTKEDFLISSGGKELFLTDETIDIARGGKMIKFRDISDETVLFVVEIMNNELTKPLYDIMALLNKEDREKLKESEDEVFDIDMVCQKFVDLLIKSGIDSSALQAEIIVNRLIRDAVNTYDRPDFTQDEIPDYNIKTVTQCIENNKSPLLGIGFQFIKRQFLSNNLYYERKAPSYIDAFFKTKVSTKKMKKFMKRNKDK